MANIPTLESFLAPVESAQETMLEASEMPQKEVYCKKPGCKGYGLKVRIRLIPVGEKFYPQLKALCINCGTYIKFLPHTPELIDELNFQLEDIDLVPERAD